MVWCICVPSSIELLSHSIQNLCRCGPQHWADKHLKYQPGHRQSPIDILTDRVSSDPKLWRNPLKWSYPRRTAGLENTGYLWKAVLPADGSFLRGGPLNDDYELEQFHCHWGSDNSAGSEHLVDGESYAAEIHFVHFNKKYGNFNEALKHGDGLAVMGVFLKVGKENAELKKLVDLIPEVKYKDKCASFRKNLDPSSLLPVRGAYWTYLGSLTTPPCNECVIWIVFKDAFEVSAEQLEAFRTMMSVDDCCSSDAASARIQENFRPPQPIGDRVVRLGYI